jgi:Cdc6-like AAA superfamily ATPase
MNTKKKTTTTKTTTKIYDYFYDIDSHQFQLWSENIPTFSCPMHEGIPAGVFVHTPSTMLVSAMLDLGMNLDESLMIVGESGVGKTALIGFIFAVFVVVVVVFNLQLKSHDNVFLQLGDKLKASCSGDLTDVFYITINTSRFNQKYSMNMNRF